MTNVIHFHPRTINDVAPNGDEDAEFVAERIESLVSSMRSDLERMRELLLARRLELEREMGRGASESANPARCSVKPGP